jgi:hypothetical protein
MENMENMENVKNMENMKNMENTEDGCASINLPMRSKHHTEQASTCPYGVQNGKG